MIPMGYTFNGVGFLYSSPYDHAMFSLRSSFVLIPPRSFFVPVLFRRDAGGAWARARMCDVRSHLSCYRKILEKSIRTILKPSEAHIRVVGYMGTTHSPIVAVDPLLVAPE